jgi:hypothetical protein
MKDHKARILSSCGNQQVRYLSPPLIPTGQNALHLARPLQMTWLNLNQAKGAESLLEPIPLARVSS